MFKRFVLISLFVLGITGIANADWTVPEQVNDSTEGLQAVRDSDTPWGIAADDSTMHFVIESRQKNRNACGSTSITRPAYRCLEC